MKKNNTKLIGVILLLLIVIISVIICIAIKGKSNETDNKSETVSLSSTGSLSETTLSTTEPTSSLTVSQTETESETETVTETGTSASSVPVIANSEFSQFNNCAFLGNSRLLALGNYDIAPHVFAKVGLTVKSVFKEYCEGGSVPVIDELRNGTYDKVFIMFGDNECGWPNLNVFADNYRDVINGVRERQPGARIYLLSCLPISKGKSDQNTYGYNINAINKVNEVIKQLAAEEGLTYIDCGSSVKGADGYLPDSYSTDGCHMKKEYNMIWAKYIADNM